MKLLFSVKCDGIFRVEKENEVYSIWKRDSGQETCTFFDSKGNVLPDYKRPLLKKDSNNTKAVPEYLEEPEDKLIYNKYGLACADNCLVDRDGNPIADTNLNIEYSCGEYDRYFTFGTITEEQDESISRYGEAEGITLDIYDTKTRSYVAKGIPECRLDVSFYDGEPEVILAATGLIYEYDEVKVCKTGTIIGKKDGFVTVYNFYDDLKTLNITNGDAFNSHLSDLKEGEFLPFNEAMMQGKAISDIASNEFIDIRVTELKTSSEIYNQKMRVFEVLKDNSKAYDKLILWFGKDTFCQMNLLSLLAYLEQIQYEGKIVLNYIDDHTFDIIESDIKVELGVYKRLYNDVLVSKNQVRAEGVILQKSLDLYYDYLSDNGSLATFIENNQDKDKKTLVCELIKISADYGISDIQAIQLIDKYIKNGIF